MRVTKVQREATDYQTGRVLGHASDRLAAESDDAAIGSNGVVAAFCESDGTWDYCQEDRQSDLIRMGYDVRGVYVMP